MSFSVRHYNSSTTPRHRHVKFRNTIIGYRRRRYRPPVTPLSHWKFIDDGQRGGVALSARKLAAGLWQLRLLAEISSGGGGGLRFQHESSLPDPKSAMEGSTKWDDPRWSKKSTEAYSFYTHMKLLEDQVTTLSVVSSLQAEVAQARLRILQLEDKHRSSKRKIEHLVRKLGEERQSRRAVIDDFNDGLSQERKNRKKIEILNSKLIEKLAKGESAAKQLTQDYEEEKRGREIMEEACKELARKIGEDKKAGLEVLKCEAMRIREEVEEERRMLQLAEVWREERVKMKLVDAKLALEYKYHQMNQLVAYLESFLSSKMAPLDVTELRKAELILKAVRSVNVQDIEEFEYVPPPKSSGVFSIFEELQQGDFGSMCIIECNDNGGGENSAKTEINYEVCSTSGGKVEQQEASTVVYKPRDYMENPHITRGMKGLVEWPRRGNQKNCSKSKLSKGLMESQKSKFRAMA